VTKKKKTSLEKSLSVSVNILVNSEDANQWCRETLLGKDLSMIDSIFRRCRSALMSFAREIFISSSQYLQKMLIDRNLYQWWATIRVVWNNELAEWESAIIKAVISSVFLSFMWSARMSSLINSSSVLLRK